MARTINMLLGVGTMVLVGYLWAASPPPVDAPHDLFAVCVVLSVVMVGRAGYAFYEALEPEGIGNDERGVAE